MRKTFLYILIIGVSFGCGKNFLDRQPTNFASRTDAYSSIQAIQSALTGCYSNLKDYRYYGRNFYLFTEVYTDNAKLSSTNTGNFSSFYNYSVISNTPELDQFWKLGYKIIARTNNIIDALTSLKNTPYTQKRQLLGEAYSIRALVYFDLVRIFAQAYTISTGVEFANGHGWHIGIPVIINATYQDSLILPQRQSVDSVYKIILNDFNKADTMLSTQNADSYTFSSSAVEALLSRVYLSMGNYNMPLGLSYNLIKSNQFHLIENTKYKASWGLSTNEESILSLSITLNNNNGQNAIGYMLSKSGYGDIVVSKDLYSLYTETDVRKQLYQKENDIFCLKYPGQLSVLGIDNIPIIRYSEIYFNYIESVLLKTNCSALGIRIVLPYLDTLMKRSDKNAIIPPNLSGVDFYKLVLNERRKEFAFEGQRYFEIKRLQTTINRIDCNSQICTITYPNYLFAMPIPISEINANKNMKQNPGY